MLFENKNNVDENKEVDTTLLFQRARNHHADACTILHENNANVNKKRENRSIHSQEIYSGHDNMCTVLTENL